MPLFLETPICRQAYGLLSEKNTTKTGSTVEGFLILKNRPQATAQDTSLTGQWTTRFYQPPCRCWELVGQKRWQQIACQESRRGWQKYFQAWQHEFKCGNWVPKTVIVKSKGEYMGGHPKIGGKHPKWMVNIMETPIING